MRIRTVKPEFWMSEPMSSVPMRARLLAIGLLNLADDKGLFWANPKLIKGQLFPYEDDPNISESLNDLARIEYIKRYEILDGRKIGKICKFLLHQRINRPTPSVLEPLIEGLTAIIMEDSLRAHGGLTEGSLWEGNGKGRERKGMGAGNERPKETRPTIKKSQGTDSPKPKAKAKKKTNPDIATFIKEFTLIFQAVNHNEKPSWGSKSAGQVKTLLSQQSLPVLIKRLGNFRAHHKAGSFGADSFDLGSFVTHLDKWAVPPKTKNARFVDPQELEMLRGCRND